MLEFKFIKSIKKSLKKILYTYIYIDTCMCIYKCINMYRNLVY